MTLLLRAVAGSFLYGTNHAGSDQDFYEVYSELPGRKAKQSIVNGVDTIKVSFSRWVLLLNTSHQALDAAFAPADMCEVDLISDFRHSFRTGVSAIHAFERVIRSFEHGNLKQRRHAVRMKYCIEDMMYTGRYNPRLSGERREKVMNAL